MQIQLLTSSFRLSRSLNLFVKVKITLAIFLFEEGSPIRLFDINGAGVDTANAVRFNLLLMGCLIFLLNKPRTTSVPPLIELSKKLLGCKEARPHRFQQISRTKKPAFTLASSIYCSSDWARSSE